MMLCHDCNKREAAVHLTQIANNKKSVLSLCKECAAARGFHSPLDNVPFPLADILSGLVKEITTTTHKQIPGDDLQCKQCGQTFEEFTRQGRFGCGRCYNAFRTRLEPIMRKIHGASLHRGLQPDMPRKSDADPKLLPVQEETRLENELKKAIEAEDFERAAELRDKLQAVRDNAAVDTH